MKPPPLKYLLICCILPLLALKCKPPVMDRRYPLHVENKSSHDIAYFIALDKARGPIYPDTSLSQFSPFGDTVMSTVPGEKDRVRDSSVPWEDFFDDYLPADKFSVFIFHPDTLRKYSWDEVRTDYKILKRYDLSLEELKRMNYIITYP